jgi:hypothetical protein
MDRPENMKRDLASTENPTKGGIGDHGAAAKKSLEKMQNDSTLTDDLKFNCKSNSNNNFSNNNVSYDVDPSSPESGKKAEAILDSKMSGFVSKEDRNLLKTMSHAILEGDPKAFGAAIASMKDHPAKLKKFVDELQKNLDQADAGVNVTVTKDGNVVVYKQDDSVGIQYDGKTGRSSVVALEHENDNVILGGQVLNKTPEDVSKDIALSARQGILGLTLEFPSPYPQQGTNSMAIPPSMSNYPHPDHNTGGPTPQTWGDTPNTAAPPPEPRR